MTKSRFDLYLSFYDDPRNNGRDPDYIQFSFQKTSSYVISGKNGYVESDEIKYSEELNLSYREITLNFFIEGISKRDAVRKWHKLNSFIEKTKTTFRIKNKRVPIDSEGAPLQGQVARLTVSKSNAPYLVFWDIISGKLSQPKEREGTKSFDNLTLTLQCLPTCRGKRGKYFNGVNGPFDAKFTPNDTIFGYDWTFSNTLFWSMIDTDSRFGLRSLMWHADTDASTVYTNELDYSPYGGLVSGVIWLRGKCTAGIFSVILQGYNGTTWIDVETFATIDDDSERCKWTEFSSKGYPAGIYDKYRLKISTGTAGTILVNGPGIYVDADYIRGKNLVTWPFPRIPETITNTNVVAGAYCDDQPDAGLGNNSTYGWSFVGPFGMSYWPDNDGLVTNMRLTHSSGNFENFTPAFTNQVEVCPGDVYRWEFYKRYLPGAVIQYEPVGYLQLWNSVTGLWMVMGAVLGAAPDNAGTSWNTYPTWNHWFWTWTIPADTPTVKYRKARWGFEGASRFSTVEFDGFNLTQIAEGSCDEGDEGLDSEIMEDEIETSDGKRARMPEYIACGGSVTRPETFFYGCRGDLETPVQLHIDVSDGYSASEGQDRLTMVGKHLYNPLTTVPFFAMDLINPSTTGFDASLYWGRIATPIQVLTKSVTIPLAAVGKRVSREPIEYTVWVGLASNGGTPIVKITYEFNGEKRYFNGTPVPTYSGTGAPTPGDYGAVQFGNLIFPEENSWQELEDDVSNGSITVEYATVPTAPTWIAINGIMLVPIAQIGFIEYKVEATKQPPLLTFHSEGTYGQVSTNDYGNPPYYDFQSFQNDARIGEALFTVDPNYTSRFMVYHRTKYASDYFYRQRGNQKLRTWLEYCPRYHTALI